MVHPILRALAGILLLGGALFANSTPVKGLKLEYRRNPAGGWAAFVQNRRPAAVTAYIAQATYRKAGQQKPTAFGGDSLSNAGGYGELPGSTELDTGNSLPADATPLTTGFIAVIYEDGSSEGDEDVVAMLLSGRHRAFADLQSSIKKLEQPAVTPAALLSFFETMKAADQAEGAQLDELIDVPGVKHRYFMSAVPTYILTVLQSGGKEQVSLLLTQLKAWEKRLAESKPPVR